MSVQRGNSSFRQGSAIAVREAIIPDLKYVRTDTLSIAYEKYGPSSGPAAVLLHGFPYDPRCYDSVGPALAAQGIQVIVPYLRGFGETRFLRENSVRSGEQAALAKDLLELIAALALGRPVVAGFDWGGRAACAAAALKPDCIGGLVSVTGYSIFGPPSDQPKSPDLEHRIWYQYYLHTDRGRMMLQANRHGFCKLLWKLWSPLWEFSEDTFDRSAKSFDNPDFVAVVLHSYRHRFGLVDGDPEIASMARQLARKPKISVPAIVLHGDADIAPLAMSLDRSHFIGPYVRLVIKRAGHNLPQEAPGAMIAAVEALVRGVISKSI